MRENAYIIKTIFAGAVDLYSVKAHSREEAIDKFRRYCTETLHIDPTKYRTVYVQMVADEVNLLVSAENKQ